ncbi:MAG TPA: aspartate-semialdehyde dehydrogenase [bacterium]
MSEGSEDAMTEQGYAVAVVGATGAVGQEMLRVLAEREFPVRELRALASERSAGRKVEFKGREYVVQELNDDSFAGVQVALFSAGGKVSERFCPVAARAGAICIDNTNAFRMDPAVPLVVPEVNPHAIARHKGIIANPNCSTIQMVVVLKPLHDAARIRRVVVSTYQATSGAGKKAMDELFHQTADLLNAREVTPKVFPYRIAFNVIPQIDVFLENGYTKEEMKMVNETKKIMEDESIRVTATTVRVPVFYGHSEAVNIETERKLTPAEARALLEKAPGVKVVDDPVNRRYPMPIEAAGQDLTFVGRIREDISVEHGLNLWISADNIRKGAATNAVQIAEILVRENRL